MRVRQLSSEGLKSHIYSINTPLITKEERNDTPRNPHFYRCFHPSCNRWDHWAASNCRFKGTFPGNKTSAEKKRKSLRNKEVNTEFSTKRYSGSAMKLKPKIIASPKSCDVKRKREAIEALLLLAWKKKRKDRPNWLIKEINSYC